MWALRRASTISLKAPGLNIAAFRACAILGPVSIHQEEKSTAAETHVLAHDRRIASKACNCTVPVPKRFSVGCRCLSSQAGAKSGGEENDDSEDGFSELETPEASETIEADVVDDDSTSDSTSDFDSEGDLSSFDASLEDTLMGDTEENIGETASKKKFKTSALQQLVLEEPGPSISGALDKYVAQGKELNRSEIYQLSLNLRWRKLFTKALQLSEWLEKREDFDFSERDYASRVDLIAKVHGHQQAESYLENVPESFRGEVVYRTLLANFVSETLVYKAEQLFNKMRDQGFPITVFTCNQMLLLYKRTDKRKIADLLLLMEKDNLKPSLFTYRILIDTKGQSNDIHGMEQVVESMKAEGIEPDLRVQTVLAKHYAFAGLKEKAKAVLKEMKGNDLKNNLYVCPIVLPIYANIGDSEEVERIWQLMESSSNPKQADFFYAIAAFGKLKNVKQAEAIFDKLTKTYKKLSSRHYINMLKVYAENKMLSEGKDMLKRMGDAGCPIGPIAWDALVKLYVNVGEVEKADSVLQKAVQQNPKIKPMFSSYVNILYEYSKRGDVHNAEKIFHRMRQAGYIARAKSFQALLQTYINAKVPCYGIKERMKADKVYPNKALANKLAVLDTFRKTSVSELLE